MMELNLVVCYFPLQTIYRDSAVRVPIMGLLLCYSFIMVIRLIESNIEGEEVKKEDFYEKQLFNR